MNNTTNKIEEIEDEYLPLNKIIERDIDVENPINQSGKFEQSDKFDQFDQLNNIYQVQGNIGRSTCNLIYLGYLENDEKSDLPIQNILSFQHPKYEEIKCEMFGYTVNSVDFADSTGYLKLIGFLLSMDGKIMCSCDYVFCPNEKLKLEKKNIENIEGTFKIILFYKQNEKYCDEVISKYTQYCGKEESIYLLTTVLLEQDVIEKYFKI